MIQVILLDIEGTTCPVDFVAKTLFPYAQVHLSQTLEKEKDEPRITTIIQEAIDEWHQDSDPTCQQMLAITNQSPPSNAQVAEYLQHLIKSDRKSTALKELQGIIWKQGYESGELTTQLFADVLPSLDAWTQKGMTLAVYSSGSVQAQKLPGIELFSQGATPQISSPLMRFTTEFGMDRSGTTPPWTPG